MHHCLLNILLHHPWHLACYNAGISGFCSRYVSTLDTHVRLNWECFPFGEMTMGFYFLPSNIMERFWISCIKSKNSSFAFGSECAILVFDFFRKNPLVKGSINLITECASSVYFSYIVQIKTQCSLYFSNLCIYITKAKIASFCTWPTFVGA